MPMPIFVQDQQSSTHAIFAFVVSVLGTFVEVKYQGKPDSPFDTHPITIFLTIFTLLLYCSLSHPLVARLPAFHTACGARIFLFLRILSFLSIVFLTRLLFRGPSFFLLYLPLLPLLILLFADHLWGLIRKLKQKILAVAFVRWFHRRGRMLLPRTVLPHFQRSWLCSLGFKPLSFGLSFVMAGEFSVTLPNGNCNGTPPDPQRTHQVVVAATRDMGIGKDGKLPWRLPSDLKHFKSITFTTTDPGKKNAVIMGRKTWEIIPTEHRPLPTRLNIVFARSGSFDIATAENVITC
ncbi:hypothetical protein NL676_038495 [Syzygium grande]|nr:hypothetical protein NL676_038495 [Syzygium grande]